MRETAPDMDAFVLGTAQLGNVGRPMDDRTARHIIDTAWDLGIRRFDTAPHYGLVLAERRLGEALRDRPRDEYRVSTKVGRRLVRQDATGWDDEGFVVPAAFRREWDPTAAGVRRSLDESLERMAMSRIDTLYLHDPDAYGMTGIDTALDGLDQLRDDGRVGRVGIGSTSLDALLAGASSGIVDELMVAGRYTLLEQPAAADLLPACEAEGVDVVAASVFNSGLLATPAPDDAHRYDHGPAPTPLVARARRLAHTCGAFDVELPAAALQYPLRHGAVRAIAVGAEDAGQLRQTVERFLAPLPDELWKRLESA